MTTSSDSYKGKKMLRLSTIGVTELQKAMESIRTLAEEEMTLNPPPLTMDTETGFTERVRAILKANPALALTAIIIRDEFLKSAPKEDPKVLLIHTHNTLKRLLKQGEVLGVATSAGRGYRWNFVSRNAFADIMSYDRLRTVADLGSQPLDPEKLPESVRGGVIPGMPSGHPVDQISKRGRLWQQIEAERSTQKGKK